MPVSKSAASQCGAVTAKGSPEHVSDYNWTTVTETQEPSLQEPLPRLHDPEVELKEPPLARVEEVEPRELWAAPAKASNGLFKAPPVELMTRPAVERSDEHGRGSS
jgi:hypothetical protein